MGVFDLNIEFLKYFKIYWNAFDDILEVRCLDPSHDGIYIGDEPDILTQIVRIQDHWKTHKWEPV